MSKIIRLLRPCSRRARPASRPRVPAPPVILEYVLILVVYYKTYI